MAYIGSIMPILNMIISKDLYVLDEIIWQKKDRLYMTAVPPPRTFIRDADKKEHTSGQISIRCMTSFTLCHVSEIRISLFSCCKLIHKKKDLLAIECAFRTIICAKNVTVGCVKATIPGSG